MKKRKASAPGPTPEPKATQAPPPEPATPPLPFDIPPDMLKKLQSGAELLSNEPMFGEVLPWGLAGFAIGALSGLVVYAKKYSVEAAIKELDAYAAELEEERRDKKNARWPLGRVGRVTSAEVELRLLRELRLRLIELGPKKTEPVKIEITQKPKKGAKKTEETCC